MKKSSRRAGQKRGFVLVYVTMTSLVLIPMTGLAIDMSVLYTSRRVCKLR